MVTLKRLVDPVKGKANSLRGILNELEPSGQVDFRLTHLETERREVEEGLRQRSSP